MAELSAEGRTIAGRLCGLLYLSASFLVGMHFLVAHFNAFFAPESTSPSSSVFLYIGGVFFAVAVVFHIFFAWRYPRQFDGRWAFSCAVYFGAWSGTIFGLPVLLSRTMLPAGVVARICLGAAAFLSVLPIVIGLVQFMFFLRRGPRGGTWRTMQRRPTSMTVWEAGDLNEEERSRIEEFFLQRMDELSGGLGRDQKE